MLQLLQLD
jgi:hypothetical protein